MILCLGNLKQHDSLSWIKEDEICIKMFLCSYNCVDNGTQIILYTVDSSGNKILKPYGEECLKNVIQWTRDGKNVMGPLTRPLSFLRKVREVHPWANYIFIDTSGSRKGRYQVSGVEPKLSETIDVWCDTPRRLVFDLDEVTPDIGCLKLIEPHQLCWGI